MIDSIQEATNSFHRWNNTWNTGDVEKQIQEMHFPNVRLDGENRFDNLETADDFWLQQASITARLEEEKWHHTSALSIHSTQAGSGKVHLVIRQSSQHADGTEYHGFNTLWIFTKIDDRWGVQFRSSFLSVTSVVQ